MSTPRKVCNIAHDHERAIFSAVDDRGPCTLINLCISTSEHFAEPGLTKYFVNATLRPMLDDVCMIESPEAAAAVLDPLRNRLLAELHQPASAAGIAARLDIPRQKVNYHLHELERLGLATVAEERRWGGLTERIIVANAATYVIS